MENEGKRWSSVGTSQNQQQKGKRSRDNAHKTALSQTKVCCADEGLSLGWLVSWWFDFVLIGWRERMEGENESAFPCVDSNGRCFFFVGEGVV